MRVLVLGGGRAQVKLIETARNLGMYVIVVGIKGDYPGYRIADKYVPVDIFDKDAVLRIAQQERIDGISMVCSDFGLDTVGYVCDHMGLMGITEVAAESSSNKLETKKLLWQHGINTAKYVVYQKGTDLFSLISGLAFPVMVKAVDLQGSRGVYLCNDISGIESLCDKAISESNVDYCIIEEFIDGHEVGAQAFIHHGEILFILPHGDFVIEQDGKRIPSCHFMPLANENIKKIKQIVAEGISAMGYDNCAINVDLIIKDNEPYIIEMTCRAGANHLPELVSEFLGINYYELILNTAVGLPIDSIISHIHETDKTILTAMLNSYESGIVKSIEIGSVDPSVQIDLFANIGSRISAFSNSQDYYGQMMVKGESLDECISKINEAKKKINMVLI